MEICSNGHSEIVYDERDCPFCEHIKDLELVTKEKEQLQQELDDINKFLSPELP